MSKITIAHLSDLHLMDSIFVDQRVVLNALFKDLAAERELAGSIDVIFFTGDLVGKGRFSADTVETVNANFIQPLLAAADVPQDRFFMVPGNHDVDQSKLPAALRPVFDEIKTTESVNRLIEDMAQMPYLWAGFQNYNKIRDGLVKASRVITNDLFESYRISIEGLTIGICAINSAWRSTGKADNYDYGELLIGQRQLDILTHSISDCTIKFAMLHHPVSWLAQFDQSIAYRQLYNTFDAIFFGHNHMADLAAVARPSGRTFLSNAGCLYQGRSYFNGYTIASFDTSSSQWKVRVREYFEERQVFSASERFAPGGVSTFDLKNSDSLSTESYFPTEEFLTSVSEVVNSQLLSSTVSDVAPRSLKQLFVLPPLCSESEKKIGGKTVENEHIEFWNFSEIVSDSAPILFVGPKEAGKTTLLNYICTYSNEMPDANGIVIATYINLHVLPRFTRAALLESMIAFSGGAYLRGHFVEMLKLGKLAVCFDNLDPQQSKQISLVQEFINEFPAGKYYISTKEDAQASLSQSSLPKFAEGQKTIYIHSFGRQQTRELMQRWFNNSNEISSEQVDSILASLKRLNIPRTPFLISVFLWVHEKRIAFDPVNHVEVIDTLIDGMLDKFQETKSRTRLDSTAKRHYLTDLAYHLYRERKDRLTHNELDLFTAEYFKRKLLTAAAGPFIEELKQKGIFLDLGEEICFKFDCLRAFFLSVRLQESSVFLSEALTMPQFLNLGEELDYFTGKYRGREDALREALAVLDKFYEPVELSFELDLFDDITLTEFPISLEDRQELGKELYPPRPSDEQREKMLDSWDAEQKGQSVAVANKKPKLPQGAVPDFFAALQITSTILRNSELIDNADLKREAYRKLIQYWAQLLLVTLLAVELREESADANLFKEIEKNMPENGIDFGFAMKIIAPKAIFGLILESLGTSQLELVIKEHANSATHCIEKLTSTMLQIDLSLQSYTDSVDAFIKKYSKNRFALMLLSMRLFEIYMFKALPEQRVTQIQKLLAEIQSHINSAGSLPQRNANKIKFLEAIKKSRKDNMRDGGEK